MSSIISQSIWVLLHLIIKGLFSLNIITLNNLLIKIASFTIYNRANNSDSVLNVITIPYLFTLQAISPLNSFIIYPYKLFLLTELSVNNAVCTNLIARVSRIPGHEIRIVLYALWDGGNCRLYKADYVVYILIRPPPNQLVLYKCTKRVSEWLVY